MLKTALITGITGQDGTYLAELLLEKDYEVHGLIRRVGSYPDSIQQVPEAVHLHFGDLSTEHHLCSLIHELRPDEIYNLAAQSDVRVSFDIPEYTADITGLGVTRLLEAVRKFSPESRVYQASSSEMFGLADAPQDEHTLFTPQSPYAAAKVYAHNLCGIYRRGYGMFISCGILFNHESPRRGKNFVTRKITSSIYEIMRGQRDKLPLGNLEASRDWGYAMDYVRAMWMMLQADMPDDFVIGTGESHTVAEFVAAAFKHVNLDWRDYVTIDPQLYRPAEVPLLQADAGKAWQVLGWEPYTSFEDLVYIMMEAENCRYQQITVQQ